MLSVSLLYWANELVIASYEAHFANPLLYPVSLAPRVSGGALAFVWACTSQQRPSPCHWYPSLIPSPPRPITERGLQIVPINSISLFTFWCFVLYFWDIVQLAGCECALFVPIQSRQVFSSKLEAEIADCQSIPGNWIFFWLGGMSCALGPLCKSSQSQFIFVYIGGCLWIWADLTTSGQESA